MINLTELNKLEKYLKDNGIKYERIDDSRIHCINGQMIDFGFYQICVPTADDSREWDAVCCRGSYGYEKGLLEIMGSIVDREVDGDYVVGWLTADDVIERIEGKK